MAEAIRFAREREEKVQEESLLKDKDFVVDLVRIVNIESSLKGSVLQWHYALHFANFKRISVPQIFKFIRPYLVSILISSLKNTS